MGIRATISDQLIKPKLFQGFFILMRSQFCEDIMGRNIGHIRAAWWLRGLPGEWMILDV